MSIVASAFQYGCAPHVDARDHDVDLAAALGERDDPAKRASHPVHVLGAGVHRDPGAGRQREPLQRDAHLLGEVERGADPGALGLGDRTERLGRVAEQDDAGDALGVPLGRRGRDAGDDAGLVEPARALDRDQPAAVVEVVLDEAAALAGEPVDELVRVHRPAAPGAGHLLRVVVQRLEALGGRAADVGDDTLARTVGEARGDRVDRAVRSEHVTLGRDLLDPAAGRQRRDRALERGELLERRVDHRPHVQPDVVHVDPGAGRPHRRPRPADRLQAVADRALHVRQRGDGAVGVADDRELAHLRRGDEPLVAGVARRDAVVQQDVVRCVEAGDLEVPQPPQVEPAGHHRVHAAHQGVLHDAAGRVVVLRAVRPRGGTSRTAPDARRRAPRPPRRDG